MKLPNSSILTSPIGIGCGHLTEGWNRDRDARIIHAAYDAGARHFDVAPSYGLGTAETVLGRALQGLRDHVTIATKVGLPRTERSPTVLVARSLAGPIRQLWRPNTVKAPGSRPAERNFGLAYIERSLTESLGRLQTDYLDIYLLHMVELADISESLVAFLKAQQRHGRFRALGIATTLDETTKILAAHPGLFDTVQYSWSVLDPPLDTGPDFPFLITHRSLRRALKPMQSWLTVDRPTHDRIATAVGMNLDDPAMLAAVLLAAALAANPSGINLVASHRIDRTVRNVRLANDPAMLAAGARLLAALALEPDRPRPLT